MTNSRCTQKVLLVVAGSLAVVLHNLREDIDPVEGIEVVKSILAVDILRELEVVLRLRSLEISQRSDSRFDRGQGLPCPG